MNFIQNFSSFFTVHGLIENTCKKWESVQRNNFSCLEKVNNLFKYYIITDNISLSSCVVGMWTWIFFLPFIFLKIVFVCLILLHIMNKEKKLLVLIDQSGGFSEDWSQKKTPILITVRVYSLVWIVLHWKRECDVFISPKSHIYFLLFR